MRFARVKTAPIEEAPAAGAVDAIASKELEQNEVLKNAKEAGAAIPGALRAHDEEARVLGELASTGDDRVLEVAASRIRLERRADELEALRKKESDFYSRAAEIGGEIDELRRLKVVAERTSRGEAIVEEAASSVARLHALGVEFESIIFQDLPSLGALAAAAKLNGQTLDLMRLEVFRSFRGVKFGGRRFLS